MTPQSITQRTEQHICKYLMAELAANGASGFPVVPFHGGSEDSEATKIEPPFITVAMGDVDNPLPKTPTWQMSGTIQIVAHSGEIKSRDYNRLVHLVYQIIESMPRSETDDNHFTFQGIDIMKTREAMDDDGDFHADIIDFNCGASS